MVKTTRVCVTNVKDIPTGEHWAILEDASIHIPGDERSRTDPGHGYPESTEYTVNYYAYTDYVEFEADLKHAINQSRSFGGHQVRGIRVHGTYKHETNIVLTEERNEVA